MTASRFTPLSLCTKPEQNGDAKLLGGLDPATLALNPMAHPAATNGIRRVSRGKTHGRFLKGPVPLPWLQSASKLPGKSLQVGVALWYRAGLEGKSTVTLTNVLLAEFGVDRYAKRRALRHLRDAGLISVLQKNGRNPVVTIPPGSL